MHAAARQVPKCIASDAERKFLLVNTEISAEWQERSFSYIFRKTLLSSGSSLPLPPGVSHAGQRESLFIPRRVSPWPKWRGCSPQEHRRSLDESDIASMKHALPITESTFTRLSIPSLPNISSRSTWSSFHVEDDCRATLFQLDVLLSLVPPKQHSRLDLNIVVCLQSFKARRDPYLAWRRISGILHKQWEQKRSLSPCDRDPPTVK